MISLCLVESQLLFDAAHKPFPWVIIWSPLVGCGFAGILILYGRLKQKSEARLTRFIPYLMLVAGAVSAIYFPCLWYFHHRAAVRYLSLGEFQTVQGIISDYRPQPPELNSVESFRVFGRQFTYSDDSFITPCFNQTALQHGPIRNGMNVIVRFNRDCILQIERLD